jgi:hypothetical protein
MRPHRTAGRARYELFTPPATLVPAPATLQLGDFVKVGFLFGPTSEAMWVRVVALDDRTGTGTLASVPETTRVVQFGHAVRFGLEHVLAVMRDDEVPA